jgi:CubicO group peptidase (beta-lactamase class C family)
VYRFIPALIVFSLSLSFASAQTAVPDALKNRPPVAAPTSSIEVAPIEVVRSKSEIIDDFGGGLLQGLLAGHGLRNAALIAAQDDRVIVSRNFGTADLDEVLYSDFLAPLAILQFIERQRLDLEADVSSIVSGYPAGATVRDVLTQQADPGALRRIVEAISGQEYRAYVSQNILEPLAMSMSGQIGVLGETMGRLLVALVNDGAFESRPILTPETIAQMRQPQFSIHPALPGWTYGFAEMRRNGWRALQRDGAWLMTPAIEARMVIVPDARIAYFVVVEGHPGASFWRTLDDALFDRILPSRNLETFLLPPNFTTSQAPSAPAPDAAQAADVAGSYETSDEPLSAAAPLKFTAQHLAVRAGEDASLHLSGSETAVLMPQPGGYWAAAGGNLNAVASDGRLALSTGLYRPLAWWKRPAPYAALTLALAVGAVGAFLGERRKQGPSTLVITLSGAVAALLMVTLFVWHLTPVL